MSLLLPSRLLVLLALLGAALPAASQAPGPLPGPEDREVLFAAHRVPGELLPRPPEAEGLQDDYDALDYELSVWLDVENERIEGENLIRFEPLAEPFPTLELDLHSPNMEVLAVQVLSPAGVSASFEHADDKVLVHFEPPLAGLSEPARVGVAYQGVPRELSFGTLTFSQHGDPPAPLIYSLAEPDLARGWWPSKDRPDDKVLMTIHVEAPEDLVVVSNGLEQSREPGRPGHLITTWSTRYPITTYLVSIAVSDFESWSDTYETLHPLTADPVSMPITHWAWPEKLAQAQEDWNVTLPMMEFYSDAYGEYPFLEEKYGHGMIRLSGAMEHQTATSYGAALVRGDHRFDFVVAHELAHQWWGDLVSPSDFDSIWLNEGFASWSEALWFEQRDGWSRYRDYMVRSLAPRSVEFPGTVHAPDGIFNDTVYHKGAWVLHMLRWVLGQPATRPDAEALLETLRAWGEAEAYDSASTDRFVDFVSTRSGPRFGAPLADWFFPQWVFREGRPAYGVGWSAAPQPAGTFRLHLRVEQVQAGETYAMPVLVRIEAPSGTIEEVVWNDQALTDYEWELDEAPTAVSWDPDDWVLKFVEATDVDADDDGWPDWLDGCPLVPNPEQEDADGNGVQDACQEGLDFDGDGILNEDDCAPNDAEAWTEPVADSLLFVRWDAAAEAAVLRFEHPDAGLERPYRANVSRGDLDLARGALAPIDAACAAASVEAEEWVDELPGERVYYLAFPEHGCTAPVSGSFLDADTCR